MSLTLNDLKELAKTGGFAAIQELRKDARKRSEMDEILRSREAATWISDLIANQSATPATAEEVTVEEVTAPSTEELAAEAEKQAAAQKEAEAARTANEAEDIAYKAVGIAITRDTKGNPIRYVQDYQIRDENGDPIGRPTHLEATTLVGLVAKQQEAHTHAARWGNRLKKQKLTFKQEEKRVVLLSEDEIKEAARQILEEKDPEKAAARASEIVSTRVQQQTKEIEDRRRELSEEELRLQGHRLAQQFIRKHIFDFNPCEANMKLLAEYITDNNLDFTLDNLEVALLVLQDEEPCRLAAFQGLPEKTSPKVSANTETSASEVAPAPSAQSAVTAAAVTETVSAPPVEQPQASQPAVVETPTPTPAAVPNAQSAARRPGVNGSLPPGSLSAQRPSEHTVGLTLQDVMKMPPEELRERKKSPQFRAQLEKLGIIDLANRNKQR